MPWNWLAGIRCFLKDYVTNSYLSATKLGFFLLKNMSHTECTPDKEAGFCIIWIRIAREMVQNTFWFKIYISIG